ncbi:CLC_0170 family protein [Pelosinus sp. sgz500959]|uniref:CLC_0170 family protein n=1 Tax=Pelosinus sp. sgz500959 TaxID=3242472 RepID=UPI00366A7F0C
MNSAELSAILLAPLSLSYAVIIILLGLYSLTFNVNDAKNKNHPCAEKTARIGGWLYMIVGLAMMIQQILSE